MFEAIRFCKENSIPCRTSGANVGAGWVGVNCPFCADHNYHGGLRGFAFNCWKCGTHSLVEYIQEALSLTWFEAMDMVKQYDDHEATRKIERREAQGSNLVLPGELSNPVAERYLAKRNFSVDYLRDKYGIRFTGPVGDFKYRVMIPIYYKGKLVSYQGRDYTGHQEIRYKTLSIEKSVINPKFLLYNEDFVPTKKKIGVCEGAFDAIRLGDGFVATLGVKTTEEQVRKLLAYDKIYIIFDPEVEAQKRARSLADKLAVFGKEVYVVNTELPHDPGDMTPEEVHYIRNLVGVFDEGI